MTWLDQFACALVDQAAIQSVVAEGSGPVQEVPPAPVTCACSRTAESEAEAIAKLWARTWAGWRCAACNAPGSVTDPAPDDGGRAVCACGISAESERAARADRWVFAGMWICRKCDLALAGDSEPLRRRIRELEAEQLALLAEHDELAADYRGVVAHLVRVLAIATETGGYLSQEHQDAIRAAREAVR